MVCKKKFNSHLIVPGIWNVEYFYKSCQVKMYILQVSQPDSTVQFELYFLALSP